MTVVTIRVCGNTFHSLDCMNFNLSAVDFVIACEEGGSGSDKYLMMNVPSACSSASKNIGIDK